MASTFCVIPARGGSKRIPRKNIRSFRGQPMIAWSIKAALDSGCFDQVLVSTDDEEIASVAQSYGASVPFLRPALLADDFAGTTDVVVHAIEQLRRDGDHPSLVCCLYATAPFVRSQDLVAGCKRWFDHGSIRPVFTAATYPFPVQRAFLINREGRADMLQPEHYETRSQDLPRAYHDAGQFYWADVQQWLARPQFSRGGVPLIMPRWRVQDVDTEEDWRQAELLHEILELRLNG
jgi:pseudaminic acid cytidylyltransferase